MQRRITRLDIPALQNQHATLEKRLQKLARRKHPTPAEVSEMRQIKRMKLAMKDRMSALLPADAA
jgi:uncharacterized protein YdcH (DUF465 family)